MKRLKRVIKPAFAIKAFLYSPLVVAEFNEGFKSVDSGTISLNQIKNEQN